MKNDGLVRFDEHGVGRAEWPDPSPRETMNDIQFKVGDVVSRDGTDEQEVIEVDHEWGLITIKCIKEPINRWIKIGETEYNLPDRYALVRSK